RVGGAAVGSAPPQLSDTPTRILGLDPGSRHTGYGIVDCRGSQATYVTCGAISTVQKSLPGRLQEIFAAVRDLVEAYGPAEIAIEKVFVNRNVDSALKLGQARGA